MSEHDDQTRVFNWARSMAVICPELLLLFAIPNGAKLPWITDRKGRRFSPEANRLKDEGMKPGVPDFCLPVARKGFHGLFIELKFGRNKPSEQQIWWMDQLSTQGYLATACWGADQAIMTLQEYVGIV